MERKIIWGCRLEALKTPMRHLEAMLAAMSETAQGELEIDGDERAVYLVKKEGAYV